MAYMYNRERPGCNCPRCRFAAANSQAARRDAVTEEKQDNIAASVADSLIPQKLFADIITAEKPPASVPDAPAARTEAPEPIEKRIEKPVERIAEAPVVPAADADGGMESFDGVLPRGWTSDTPELISPESGYGYVHTGDYSVRLRDGGTLSFDVPVKGSAGGRLSFYALGTGKRTGLYAAVFGVSAQGESQEFASVRIREGDLPYLRGNFGYYTLDVPVPPSGVQSFRIEFTASAPRRHSVLLDDVSFLRQH